MEQQEKIPKSIYEKMSDIQGMNITINKDKQAHGYAYATLDQIMEKLSPILKENRLLVHHVTDWDHSRDKAYLKTIITDIDNPQDIFSCVTYLDDTITLPGQNKVMVTGSLITYYRRYHVTSMFGLTTETDTDAGGAVAPGRTGGRSVESAPGAEKPVDFVGIFTNMIQKGKAKDVVEKQFASYKPKMNQEQINSIKELINNIK
jgi:ERF superfamily